MPLFPKQCFKVQGAGNEQHLCLFLFASSLSANSLNLQLLVKNALYLQKIG